MKHLKIYEYYYDQNGELYSDDEAEDYFLKKRT